METILGLCIGIGLSAACGFRVFVPLLVMSIAALMGWFEPMTGFEWLAMPAVCLALAIATICEIAAYYIPWVDNAIDTIATPAPCCRNSDNDGCQQWRNVPVSAWAAAIIVGGGTAGAVQMSSVAARGLSTATTGGVANPVLSTGEWIGAILLSILSLLLPVLAALLVVILAIMAIRWIRLKKKNKLENSAL
jgi:hypothetical protein